MSLKDIAALIVWFVLRPVVKLVPLRALYKIAGLYSIVSYVLNPGKKREIKEELKRLLPDKGADELDAIVRKGFDIYFKRMSEKLVFNDISKEFIDANVSIEGIEHVDAALSKGKGAVILVSHFGSFLFVPLVLTFKDYKITQLAGGPTAAALSPAYKIIGDSKHKETEKQPLRFCRADVALTEVYKVLKRNELLAVALDGRVGKNWVEVEMFGRKAMLLPGPVRIAMKSRAPIIMAFMIRNEDDTQRLVLEPSIEMHTGGNYDENVLINMRRVAEVFERYVKKYPGHYALVLQVMRLKHKRGIIDYPLVP
ncbi:MAG: hypothetical protein A3J24_00840 [Deltaproteobacteria bacterium RIFCSPLOWO2_02_FULL_53_8]|nr:MAG: hypothetical protein A3J24_00840 [Deltaproteobacteria bacterium RIFCSPLOWO2_02_FULL_53_8]